MSGSSMFCAGDLKNSASLAAKLQNVCDPVSQYLRGRFSSNTQHLLYEYDGCSPPSKALQRALIDEFNRLLGDPHLLTNVQRFAQVVLTKEAQRLTEQDPQSEDLIRLNRLLLEGAYPQAIGRDDISTRLHVDKTIYTPSIKLGPRTSYALLTDPNHMVFALSRYKFCAKLLQGKISVLEVGCGDAFGSPVVAQSVKHLFCVDCESKLIEGNKERLSALRNVEFHTMDMINVVPDRTFDAAFSIDVIEHVEPEEENAFATNICRCLTRDGILVIGTPNIEARKFASEPGASPHINLKSDITLRQLMDRLFVNSFIFSMNDEVVHTGFYKMAHYLFGIGIGVRCQMEDVP